MRVRQKICLVDDDNAVRHSLRILLELNGFEVEEFAGGQEYLNRMRTGDASCLVLDLYMPGMDGVDVLNALQRERIAIPAIMLTGRPESPRAQWALQAGARAVLTKPVQETVLLEAIQAAIEAALPSGSHAVLAGHHVRAGNRLHTIP